MSMEGAEPGYSDGGPPYDPRGRVAEMVMMMRSTCLLVADYMSTGMAVMEPSLIFVRSRGSKEPGGPALVPHEFEPWWCRDVVSVAAVSHVRWE